jgi:UDP-glucose 4-epimerase/UDP-arabinose 4-epimerase
MSEIGTADSGRTAVLVAGGAGFIGAQTCKALHRAGYLPVTLDNLSKGYAPQVKWGPLHQGDLRDGELVKSLVRQYDIKGALHFAAFIEVGESVRNPFKYWDNNVSAAMAFAGALIEAGVEAFLFSSTAAVYGTPQYSPIPESHPTQPINPYGWTKLVFERALADFGAAYPFRWTALRYFNAAGADLDGEIGESHEPESHLIPLAAQAALGRGKPLTVFGQDYPTPDGTPIRDYIHVVDLAEAHVEALGRLIGGGENLILNVGTGQGHTVLEVMEAAERVGGRPVPRSFGPRRAGDPPALVADAGEIQRRFSWRPRHSDLETILRTAWRWQSERPY